MVASAAAVFPRMVRDILRKLFENLFFLDSLFVSAGYDANVNVWCNHTHQLRNTYKVSHYNTCKMVQEFHKRKLLVFGIIAEITKMLVS